MVATTCLYITIILCYVINSTVRCQIWGDVGPTQKNDISFRDFFVSANIIQQTGGRFLILKQIIDSFVF
jgi:hypothetical protein